MFGDFWSRQGSRGAPSSLLTMLPIAHRRQRWSSGGGKRRLGKLRSRQPHLPLTQQAWLSLTHDLAISRSPSRLALLGNHWVNPHRSTHPGTWVLCLFLEHRMFLTDWAPDGQSPQSNCGPASFSLWLGNSFPYPQQPCRRQLASTQNAFSSP